MSQLMMFALGLVVGIVIGVLGANFSQIFGIKLQVAQDLIAMEDMYEQFMAELEEKYQTITEKITEQAAQLEQATNKRESVSATIPQKQGNINKNVSNIKGTTDLTKTQVINQMLAEGYYPEAIAKKLGIGQGEVDLLLKLEKMKKSD